MIISYAKQFVFLRIPKTGTTTTQFLLRMANVWHEDDVLAAAQGGGVFPAQNYVNTTVARREGTLDEIPEALRRGQHVTPKNIVEAGLLTAEQFREFDCYAFVRNPYERFLSGVTHAQRRYINPRTFDRVCKRILSGEGITDVNRIRLNLLTIPQYPYLYLGDEMVVTPLDFRDFETHVRALLGEVGSDRSISIPRFNRRRGWTTMFDRNDFWTETTLQLFEGDYARDLALYQQLYGIEAMNRPVPTYKFIDEDGEAK